VSEDPRIDQIREAMDGLDKWEHDSAHRVVERIRAILDSPPTVPAVFFPGDTVPAHTPVVNHVGGVWRQHTDRVLKTGWAVELQLPADSALQAAVDRVHQVRLAEATKQPHLTPTREHVDRCRCGVRPGTEHVRNCAERCQDCGGDPDGPRRCDCRTRS
jgi:hypothetical protein